MSIEKGKISSSQLLFLVAGFVQGSVLLLDFTIGITERQTWFVTLASLVVTIPFVFFYAALAKRFPSMNVIQINDLVYGRFLGKVVSIYYIFFFIMTLSFNIRDVGDLYRTFLMPDTPHIIMLAVFAAVCGYAVSKGIEVIARIGHIFVVIAIFAVISTFILLIGNMDFSNFLPLFDLKPVKILHGINVMASIPYGETIIFLMIIASVKKPEHAVKNSLLGLIIGGLTLLFAAVRNTAVLGNTQAIWTSPSFQSTRLIDIGTVLTRMDFLVGIAQTMLIFLKCSLFFYALAVAFSQLFGLKSYVPLILPLAGIEVIIAATVYQSPVDHAEITLNAGIMYSVPLMFIIPPVSLLVAKIRSLPKYEGGRGT